MHHSVFISYARATNKAWAGALHEELTRSGLPVFLDQAGIAVGERFPDALLDALLSAHVVVVFADATYFTRWYCLTELRIALSPALGLPPGAPRSDIDAALAPLVLALPPEGLSHHELERLPPALQSRQWLVAGETRALASLVRERLAQATTSLGERLKALGRLGEIRAGFQEASSVPPPGNLAGQRLYPLDLMPSLGNDFVGRADEMWRLDFMLSTLRGDARQNAAPAVAMEGGGGFGKTRLALEYVHRFGPMRFPGGVIWLDADAGPARLEAQHHEALRVFRPGVPDLHAFHEQGRSATAELAQALHSLPSQELVLFVVDNVPEPEPGMPPNPLRLYCPAVGRVTLLVTSRHKVSLGEPGVQSLPLDTLSPGAAVTLLTRGLVSTGGLDGTWHRIADWVGHLPLALELLNRVLVLGGLSPDELLLRAEHVGPAGELDRQMEALRGQIPEGRLRGITEALVLSYERLTEPEREASRLIAQLSPAPILFETLKALHPEGFPPGIRNALVARSFVTRLSGREKHWLGRMHRVLADFLRSQAPQPVEEALRVCRGFVALLPSALIRDPRAWPLIELHLPHVEWVFHGLSREERLADEPGFVKLGLAIAVFLLATRQSADALEYAGWLRQRASVSLGGEHELTLEATTLLAQALQQEGNPVEARKLKTAVVESRRRALGDEHPETLRALNDLAVSLQEEGRWPEALTLREQVLAASQRTLGPEHPYTLGAMSNLAQSLLFSGALERARSLSEQHLEILRHKDGDDSSEVFSAMGTLAAVFEEQGDPEGARELEEQVVEGRRRLFGDEHEATLNAMSNLAVTFRTLGQFPRSRELFEDVLEVRLRLLGEEHPLTLDAMSHLAATLHALGDFRGSVELKQRVLDTRARVCGEDHPSTLIEMNNLAVTLCHLGELPTSRLLAERGLALCIQKLGEAHPLTLGLMSTLALVLGQSGDRQEAKRLREQELEYLRQRLGEEHPRTLVATAQLAQTLMHLDELSRARALLEKAVRGLVQTRGEEHPETLHAMNHLALLYRKQGDLQRSRRMSERLLNVNQRMFGTEHFDTLTVMHNLASILQEQGEHTNARALYEKTLESCVRTLGIENPHTAMTAWNLYCLLTQLGDTRFAGEVLTRNLSWLLELEPSTLMPPVRTIQKEVRRILG